MRKNMTSLWRWSLSAATLATLQMKYKVISSDADGLPPSSSEEEKIEKTRKYQKEYHRKYYKEKQQQPYMCRICGRTLSVRQEKSKRCTKAKNIV